jgi:hypothetical protein
MPEISTYFGNNFTLEVVVDLDFNNENFIKISEESGLKIGDNNVFSFDL